MNTQSRCTTSPKTPAQNNALTVILLCAGAGRRMKGKGTKSLLPMGHSTLLEHQLQAIWKMYDKAEVVVITGFQAAKIRNAFRGVHPIRLVYNPLHEAHNVMYSIALGLENTSSKNLLILHGDILFNTNAIANITDGASKIMVLPENYKTNGDDVGVVLNNNCITNMSYGLPRLWGQMVYFTGKETTMFEKIAFNHEASSNWFFYEGINNVIDNGGIFTAHCPANTRWMEVDSIEDLKSAKGLMI